MIRTRQVICTVKVNYAYLAWLLENSLHYIPGWCGPKTEEILCLFVPLRVSRAHLCSVCMSVPRHVPKCAWVCMCVQGDVLRRGECAQVHV